MSRSHNAIWDKFVMKPQYFPCRLAWGGCGAHGSFLTTEERDQHESPCRKARLQDLESRAEQPAPAQSSSTAA